MPFLEASKTKSLNAMWTKLTSNNLLATNKRLKRYDGCFDVKRSFAVATTANATTSNPCSWGTTSHHLRLGSIANNNNKLQAEHKEKNNCPHQRRQLSAASTTTTPPPSSSSSSSSESFFSSESSYHTVADETLEGILDTVEQALEDQGVKEAYEITLSNGVLTLALPPHGTWVINKQTPNKQLWWSSPMSGPRRYEYDAGDDWKCTRDGEPLYEKLRKELKEIYQVDI